MGDFKAILFRLEQGEKQTTGRLILTEGDRELFECYTLELPDRDNKRNVSRIPEGVYKAEKHVSPKFGPCIWIKDVPGRSEILLHKGNFNKDTRGCILPGSDLRDIDGDGLKDVTNSSKTVKEILKLTPKNLTFEIIDAD